MKAHLFIDGMLLGTIDYEHPKNDRGEAVPLPTGSDDYQSEAGIIVDDGDGNRWIGTTKLERVAT